MVKVIRRVVVCISETGLVIRGNFDALVLAAVLAFGRQPRETLRC